MKGIYMKEESVDCIVDNFMYEIYKERNMDDSPKIYMEFNLPGNEFQYMEYKFSALDFVKLIVKVEDYYKIQINQVWFRKLTTKERLVSYIVDVL